MYHVEISFDTHTVIVVLAGLFAFGWAYDKWVGDMIREGDDRGYMGFIVSLGCFVTIIGFAWAIASLELGLLLLGCFTASGVSMIWGSINRHNKARRQSAQLGFQKIKDAFDER